MAPASVVVLSYNRPHYLREALRAIARQALPPAEILVVDNRSPASAEVARAVAECPGARLIANATNLGFTGGMNVGIRAASADYVLLTEDDIVAEPQCLGALVGHLRANPDVGLCTGVMLNREAGTIRCAGGELGFGPRYRKRVLGENEADCGQYREPFAVTYLPGALVCARRADLRRWGGFREDFFMYHEDDELCLRVARAGRRIMVVPQARAYHFEPAAGPSPPWLDFLKIRNFLRLHLLYAPARSLPAFLARYVGWGLLRDGLRRRPRARLLARASLDTLRQLPHLLRDRRRSAPRRGESNP
jgi:GT2 family glycosyltransferase